MKNLKKVLALVLVVAMMASFATVSAAFPDADSISHTEAVEVLASLGVIGGYADGTFRPTNLVTRGAFAKMAAYVMNSGKNAAASFGAAADAAFSDVESIDTLANSIGYVVSKGYVDGYADGTFNPGGNVTGVAAAKILLNALGITGEYTGTNWKQNVINAGEDIKLFANLDDVDLTAALTREHAAQMILNAAAYTPTGYVYSVNGMPFDTYYDAAVFAVLIGGSVADVDIDPASDTLLATKFGVGSFPSNDEFGRPGTRYSNGTTINVFFVDTPVLTFTKGVTGKQLYAALGLTAVPHCVEYLDGYYYYDDYEISNASTDEFGGNGILTEVYKTAADEYTVVQIGTYYDIVYSVVESTDPTTGKKTTTVTLTGGDTTTEFTNFKKDDAVVFTYSDITGEIESMVPAASVVAGTVTATGADYIKLDGVKYELNDWANLPTIGDVGGALTAGAKSTLYLDAYGYIIGAILTPGAQPAKDVWYYGYLINYEAQQYEADGVGGLISAGTNGKAAGEKFQIVTANGETVILDGAYTVDKNTNKVTKFVASGDATVKTFANLGGAQLVAYTLSADGKVASIDGTSIDGNACSYTKGNATLTGSSLLLDAETVFFYTYTQDSKTVYEVLVGYQNAKSFAMGTNFEVISANGVVEAIVVKSAGTVEQAPAPKTYVYVADDAVETVAVVGGTDVVYTGLYLDGVAGELTFDTDPSLAKGGLYEYTVNPTTGLASIVGSKLNGASNTDVTAVAATYFQAGTIKYVGANTKYFQVDALTGAVTAVASIPAGTLTTDTELIYVAGGATSAALDAATVVYFTVTAK